MTMAFVAMFMVTPPALLVPAAVGRSALAHSMASRSTFSRRFAPPAAVAVASPGIEVLFDSQCMVCLTNKALLNWFDRGRERLSFIDIRSPSYSGAEHGGVSYDDAMAHFHVVARDGTVAEGSEAVFTAYQAVGLGWFINVLRLPIVRWLVDGMYSFVSRHRHTISRFMPGGRALANAVTSVHDLNKAAQGEEPNIGRQLISPVRPCKQLEPSRANSASSNL